MSINPIETANARSAGSLSYDRCSRLTTKLIIAVFFCGIFEGAARKWFLPPSIPEISYLAYLSKFLVFWAICVAIDVSTSPSRSLMEYRSHLQLGLALLCCGALLSAASGFSITGGVLTTTMTVVGPVLAYFGASKLRIADSTRILRWIAIMSIAPALLGLIQFELPPTHPLNRYLGDSSWLDIVTDLGRVRATGTFSFISGMSAMAVVCIWAGLCLRVFSSRRKDQIFGLVAIVAGFACSFTALSRSAIFMGLALMAFRLFFVGRDRQLLVIIIVGALGYSYLSFNRPMSQVEPEITVTSGVFVRHSRADSVTHRLGSWGRQLLDATKNVPFGNGFGTNQVGAKAVSTGQRVLTSYEAELARLVAEVGVVGLLGVLVVRFGLLLALFHAWSTMPSSPSRDSVLLSMATLSMFFVTNTAFNHVAAGFAWPIAAIALAWASNGGRASE